MAIVVIHNCVVVRWPPRVPSPPLLLARCESAAEPLGSSPAFSVIGAVDRPPGSPDDGVGRCWAGRDPGSGRRRGLGSGAGASLRWGSLPLGPVRIARTRLRVFQ